MSAEHTSPEARRYLIEELETVVNSEYLPLLKDSVHTFSIRGYQPATTAGVPDIIGLELDAAGLVPDTLEGVDVEFSFPASDPYGAIRNYVMHWHNGVNWTYAETEQLGPIAYAGHGDRIVGDPNIYRADDISALVMAAGLPFEAMASQEPADLENVLTTFSEDSSWMHLSRDSCLPINAYSSLRIVQDSIMLHETESAQQQVVQELRLEVRHFQDVGERFPEAALYNIPTAHPVRAQHIVFHRNLQESRWQYYATYDGPIKAGELLGKYEESIDQLIAPPVRLAIQINEALENSTL